jgi:hypothetical protein
MISISLRVYKQQMEAEGKLPKTEASTATSGEHGATESASTSGEHGATESTSAAHSSSPASGSEHATAPHKLAKRAIEDVHKLYDQIDTDEYNPMNMAMEEQHHAQQQDSHRLFTDRPSKPSLYAGYLTWGSYAAQTVIFSTMQLITSHPADTTTDTLQQQTHHHLVRRSGPAAESESAILSDEEKIFVYKTFLIFGGGIFVVNSFIKLLNTKISGMERFSLSLLIMTDLIPFLNIRYLR